MPIQQESLKRIASGVYRIKNSEGIESVVSGKLHDVMYAHPKSTLQYLIKDHDGLTWKDVNVQDHRHYHGEQQKLLLRWFHQLECALSHTGFHRFSCIAGVSSGRIKDALRRPDTSNYKPFSESAMLFLEYQVTSYLSISR